MARLSWAQRLYWRYFSKPVACREVFAYALEHSVGSILEIGMGNGERITALLPLCRKPDGAERIRYAALDPFESGGSTRLTLKGAHRLLQELGVKAHLIPGDMGSGVVRLAHTVLPSDLVLIDGHWDNGSEESKILSDWLPRLCHSQSAVFGSREPGGKLTRVSTPAAVEFRTRSQAA
ncbi:MAG: hypothetical protein ACK553_08205 [Planctomycetota bacterium]|jgi:hypothetical protein